MKILVKPSLDIDDYLDIDGLILPLDKYSVDYDTYFSIEDIKSIREKYNGEIFVVLNRMFFNSDIDSLSDVLKELEKLNLTGIFFYDLAVLQLRKELDLKTDLVWNATHMVTNYNTCNYYFEKGVKYALLANEITLDEVLEIKEKSMITPMFNLIGYPVVANSYRNLITNYNKMHNLEVSNNLVVEEFVTKDKYIIEESLFGTTFKYGKVLNNSEALNILRKVDFPYVILNEEKIEHKVFLEVLDIIKDNKNIERIEELIGNNTGFLNKQTIYKVKKNG